MNAGDGKCTWCENQGIPSHTFYSEPFLLLYAVIGAAVFVRVFRRRLDVNGDGNVDMDDCAEACGPRFPLATRVVETVFSSILIKIMISLYQILGPVASNLGVQFPPMVTSALKGFSFLSLDLFPELNLACIYNASYLDQIMFYCLSLIHI